VLVMDVGSIIGERAAIASFRQAAESRTRISLEDSLMARPRAAVTVASGLALQPIDLKNQERNDVWVA